MRYERLFALGSGGMATVELALATGPGGFNRLVVLKSMRKDLSAHDETYRMFLAEARLSARLNHPNVVQVSEVLETSEGIVLVMEYLDGLPLSGVYRATNEALTLPMRLRVICEVLAGLHYAHELADFQGQPLQIVHRDVSPQNIFVTYDGRIKLLDFGIAKVADSGEQTRAGMIKGRLAYMPMEQLTSSAVDRRTDIYAVGCLLWEAVAGGRIWADQTERDIARSVLSGKIPKLSSRVDVDPELEAIVSQATAAEPDARYATAEAMRAELEDHLMKIAPAVTAREIGDMLSRLSAESRERRRAAIAEAIAAVEARGEVFTQTGSTSATLPHLLSNSRLRHGGGSSPNLSFEDGGLLPASGSASVSAKVVSRDLPGPSVSVHQEEPGGGTRFGAWLGLIAALAAGAVYWFGPFGHPPADRQAGATPTGSETLGHEASTRSMRSLRIEVTPSDARVFVDDAPVAGHPALASVPAGSEHVVRVEREGHESTLRKITVTEDVQLDIALAPEPVATDVAPSASGSPSKGRVRYVPGRVMRGPAATPAPAASAATAPAPAAAANCDPPYYFSNGNKTYKPECI
jgi:serine/threonine protein kinase